MRQKRSENLRPVSPNLNENGACGADWRRRRKILEVLIKLIFKIFEPEKHSLQNQNPIYGLVTIKPKTT